MKVSIQGSLMEGRFIKRINRFLAEIEIDGKSYHAHVPNTGRMKEFLQPGARIIVRQVIQEHRKTIFDLLMVYENDVLINIDSKLPNILLEMAFKRDDIKFFRGFNNVRKEIKYGKSRFDLAVTNGEQLAFIEAKCVTYVEDDQTALFPDAPTDRGRKHVLELIEALNEGIRAAVFFIIQREDALRFTPNYVRDPLFSKAVEQAHKAGVEFYALNCIVTPHDILLNEVLPVLINA